MLEPSWLSVVQLAHKYGAKYPELAAAQFALESGFGLHTSGKNNYFGLKGKGTRVRTREVYNGREEYVYDNFLDFNTFEESVKYLVEKWYLDYKNYKGVNNAPSREAAAYQLQREVYATDPIYATLLIDLMNTHAKEQIVDEKTIKLLDAAKYYNGEPHQDKAWKLLQDS